MSPHIPTDIDYETYRLRARTMQGEAVATALAGAVRLIGRTMQAVVRKSRAARAWFGAGGWRAASQG
jgi:hypothetical protein